MPAIQRDLPFPSMVQRGRHIRLAAVLVAVTAVLFLSLTPCSTAQTVIDWQFGLTQAVLSDLYQPWAIGPGTGAGIGLSVSENTRLRLGFFWRRLWDDTASENTVKLPHPASRAARAWTQTLLSAGVEYLLGGPESLSLFGSAGLGLSFWRVERYPDYEAIVITDGDGGTTDYSASEAVISFGLGARPRLVSSLRLRAQCGVDYFTGLGPDLGDLYNNERSRAQLWFTVGLSLPLGGGGRPLADAYGSAVPPTPVQDDNDATPSPSATTHATSGDADGDGIPDTKDRCPDTPAGAIVDRHGCPLDADGDGIYDGIDRCPGTTPLMRAYVDSFGCPTTDAVPSIPLEKRTVVVSEPSVITDTTARQPTVAGDKAATGIDEQAKAADHPLPVAAEPDQTAEKQTDSTQAQPATPNRPPVLTVGTPLADSDGDGVADTRDWCPNTLAGLPVDRNGCLIMTQLQRRLILRVSYLPGTTAPDQTSLAILDDLIVRLKREPEVQVTVEGFTDNIGLEEDNLAVSQKRADRIKAYLVKNGIAAARITAIGRGETEFIADNATAAGRQKNRRIEISFQRP